MAVPYLCQPGTVEAVTALLNPERRIRPALECHDCGSAIEPGAQLHLYPDAPVPLCPPCCEAHVRPEIRAGVAESAMMSLHNAVARLGSHMDLPGKIQVMRQARLKLDAELACAVASLAPLPGSGWSK